MFQTTIFAIESRRDPKPSIIYEAITSRSTTCRPRGLPRLFFWSPGRGTGELAFADRRLTEVDRICRKLALRRSPIERMSEFIAGEGNLVHMVRTNRVVYEPLDGKGDDVSEANVYYGVEMLDWSPLRSSSPTMMLPGFWDFRCRDLTATDSLANGFSSATLHTGICLFSEALLGPLHDTVLGKLERATGSQESVDSALKRLEGAEPTLYEVEAVSRLSSGVAMFTKLLHDRFAEKPGRVYGRVRVVLDIPTAQYYELAFRALHEGTWSVEQALRWTTIIKHRAHMLSQHLEGRIRQVSVELGLDLECAGDMVIERCNGLQSVERYCEGLLVRGESVDVGELISLLKSDTSSGWSEALEVDWESSPSSFSDLAMQSYSVALLRSALIRGPETLTTASDNRHLVVCIDSSAERRTFFQATKMLKELRKRHNMASNRATLLGAYPLEMTIATGGVGTSTLYTDDPGNVTRLLD